MGKIIEFKSEHDLDIGTVLWAVGEKDVRKYKPCPTCENQRTIKVHDGKGNEYDMPCPRCTGQQTKGGACGEFKHYKAVAHKIHTFEFGTGYSGDQVEQKIKLRHFGKDNDYRVRNDDITDSELLTASGRWRNGEPIQFYISEEEAKAEAKRLNAEQAALIKAFLEGGE